MGNMENDDVIKEVQKSFEGDPAQKDVDEEKKPEKLSILTVQLSPNDTSADDSSYTLNLRKNQCEFLSISKKIKMVCLTNIAIQS